MHHLSTTWCFNMSNQGAQMGTCLKPLNLIHSKNAYDHGGWENTYLIWIPASHWNALGRRSIHMHVWRGTWKPWGSQVSRPYHRPRWYGYGRHECAIWIKRRKWRKHCSNPSWFRMMELARYTKLACASAQIINTLLFTLGHNIKQSKNTSKKKC